MFHFETVIKFALSLSLLCSLAAEARGQYRKPASIPPSRIIFKSVPQIDNPQRSVSTVSLEKVLTEDLSHAQSPTESLNQIADRSLATFFESEVFKGSQLGHISDRVKEEVRADVNFSSGLKEKIEHKLSLEMQAFNQEARLSYSGYVAAKAAYKLNASEFNLELKEKYDNKDIYFAYSSSPLNTKNEFGISWDW